MAITSRARMNLESWAKRGDHTAQGIVYAYKVADASGVEAVVTLTAPAAASTTAVHADVFGDAVGPVTVNTAITNPVVSRNLELAFGATYDGGNVTVVGTNQYGVAVSEVFTANPGNTVTGVKIFKTVTSFSYAGGGVGAHATNTVSVGIGNKLAIGTKVLKTDLITVLVAGVEDAATVDATYNAFTPSAGNLPNAAKNYEVHCTVAA